MPKINTLPFDDRKIPRRFFYIAIGPIPEEYLLNMRHLAIAAQEHGFEVEVFVDDEKNIHDAIVKSDRLASLSDINPLKVKNISQITDGMSKGEEDDEAQYAGAAAAADSGNYTSQELQSLRDMIAADMVGLKNLASVSDILRYEELRQNGGYYLDWDTIPHLEPDMVARDDCGFKFNAFYFRHNLEGGNDIIGSVAHHPILNCILKNVANKYQENKTLFDDVYDRSSGYKISLDDARRDYDAPAIDSSRWNSARMERTQDITGPIALTTIVQDCFDLGDEKSASKFLFPSNYPHIVGVTFVDACLNVAGFDLMSRCTGSWLQKKKPAAFDTEFHGDSKDQVSGKKSAAQLVPTLNPPPHPSSRAL